MNFFQAITVKYLPETNYRGQRYKAFCAAGSITVSEKCSLPSNSEQAVRAMKFLCEKLHWDWASYTEGGVLKSGDYVFVRKQD